MAWPPPVNVAPGAAGRLHTPLMRVIAFLFATLTVAAHRRGAGDILSRNCRRQPTCRTAAGHHLQSAGARSRLATCRRTDAPVPFLTAVMLCFEKQGGSPVVEAEHLPLLHPARRQPAVAERRGCRYNDSVAADGDRATSSGSGRTNFLDDLADRGARLRVLERRRRQGRRLQHGGAAARQDRRLRRHRRRSSSRRSTRS